MLVAAKGNVTDCIGDKYGRMTIKKFVRKEALTAPKQPGRKRKDGNVN